MDPLPVLARRRWGAWRLAPALFSISLLMPGVTWADDPPHFSAEKLDEMTAPVALYPDPILSQVMTAATFPDEVKDAHNWAKDHKDLTGQALADAMTAANFEWDASVQALVPFPSVLDNMTRDSGWLKDFGNAVLAQRGDVMDSVQRMRKKAQDAGNLKSSEHMTVSSPEPTVIEIQPANPQVIYVPTYDPEVVYAPAPAASSGGNAAAAAMFGFMAGVAVAEMFDDDWYGGCGFYWGSHTVVVHNSAWGRTWVNRGYYAPPYPRGPVYANRNVNVNVDRDVNINTGDVNIGSGNVDIDREKNVERGDRDDDRGDLGDDRGDKSNRDADRGSTGRGDAAGKPASAKQLDAKAKPAVGSDRPAGATAAKGKTAPGSAARGYERTPAASSKSALSGSGNGRTETAASKRGRSSSSAASHASGSRAGGSHSSTKRGGR